MRVLFVENNDSFSWNVIDCLPVARRDVLVRSGAAAAADLAGLAGSDVVVVGPGPTDPVRAGIVGLVRAVADLGLPLLGICLGNQALGLAFGAQLVRVTPMHGKITPVTFRPSRLFPGIVGTVDVMRYHSLALAEVADPLRVVATSPDGLPMAIEHTALPLAGLQFHPDSYATPRGREIVAAFFDTLPCRG
jgi:anthranilate synthase/aminodeoxychorismate synthase-like glutamine amidotransferase